jgi:Zn-dependent protease with chaperone function
VTSAAPTILSVQADSAWAVILTVSLVALPAVLLLRRLINRPGGLASGLLLSLPLVLPLVAALMFGHPLLPEIAVLRPAVNAVVDGSGGGLDHLVLLRDSSGRFVIPYALAASTGPWLVALGGLISSMMLLRRALGCLAMRRVIRRCSPVDDARRSSVAGMTSQLSRSMGLSLAPQVLLLPEGTAGTFAVSGQRVLISRDLLDCLDDSELEATLAHELAHLKARDVLVVGIAGFLRDVVAWNPVAHLALRKLTMDRELEADRRAAAVTGQPLAVASSLLKVCELMRGRGVLRPVAALGFGPAKGRVSRRVSNMLELADGGAAPEPAGSLPFAVAATLAAVLALQVGAQLADRGEAALAFVWGTPTADKTLVWTPRADVWDLKERTVTGQDQDRRANQSGKRGSDRSLPPRAALAYLQAAPAVAESNLDSWVTAVMRAARKGIGPRVGGLETRQGWRAQPLIADGDMGPFGVYRVEQLELPAKLLSP